MDEALEGVTSFDLAMIIEQGGRWCVKCGECCRRNDPIKVSVEDLLKIANFLGIDLYTVIANYTKPLQDGTFTLKAKPCIFLQVNLCTIYPARPHVCRAFPLIAAKDYTTLGLYKYCSFGLNYIVHKAIALLTTYLIEREHPEIKTAMQKYMKQLEKIMPKDQAGQVLFLVNGGFEHFKKRKEKGYPPQT